MARERGYAGKLTLAWSVVMGSGGLLAAQEVPGSQPVRRVEAVAEPAPASIRTEVVRERYPSQAVRLERHITQDEKLNFINHGPWTMWDPAGNLIAKGEYRFGKRNGDWKRWFVGDGGVKSGDPKKSADDTADAFTGSEYAGFTRPFVSEARFESDKLVGPWTVVDAEGREIFSVDLDRDVLHGKATTWHPNGTKRREIDLRAGIVDGEWKEWDQSGALIRNDHYLDGCRLAEAVVNFETGEKSAEGAYLYAKDIVKADLDWWTGRLNIQITPSDGKQLKQGKWTYWHQTGEKRCDAEYLDDKPVGVHTWWYRNGQKECEGRYIDGLAEGTWTFWHENGLQSAQGNYKAGAKVGRWVRWNAEGKVTESTEQGATAANGANTTGPAGAPRIIRTTLPHNPRLR